nr:major facilitator family transporter [Raoultella sp. NCTC 9187]
MTARWQGTIALLLLIIISYIDRVNISVMILNPEFAAHFQLNENRMLQGMLMTCFLVGYGLSALLLTPVIENRLHYRQGLLISIAIWGRGVRRFSAARIAVRDADRPRYLRYCGGAAIFT